MLDVRGKVADGCHDHWTVQCGFVVGVEHNVSLARSMATQSPEITDHHVCCVQLREVRLYGSTRAQLPFGLLIRRISSSRMAVVQEVLASGD